MQRLLAKIQVTAIYSYGLDMRRNGIFLKMYRDYVCQTPSAHLDGDKHGDREPAETSVTEFFYKSVNLSLEELKNVSIIL